MDDEFISHVMIKTINALAKYSADQTFESIRIKKRMCSTDLLTSLKKLEAMGWIVILKDVYYGRSNDEIIVKDELILGHNLLKTFTILHNDGVEKAFKYFKKVYHDLEIIMKERREASE